MKKNNNEAAIYSAKHYKSEKNYVLFLPMKDLFLNADGKEEKFVNSTKYSAVEANRISMDYFNKTKVFPIKMKICSCKGIDPLASL